MIFLYSSILDTTITLPKELIWKDEFTWTNVKSRIFYSIEGDAVIEYSNASRGKPITLEGQNAVIKRETIAQLYNWANIPNHEMVLTLHDLRNFDVLFRYWDTAFEVFTPFEGYSKPNNDSKYTLTLRLVEI